MYRLQRMITVLIVLVLAIPSTGVTYAQTSDPPPPESPATEEFLETELDAKIEALGPENRTPSGYDTPVVVINGVEQVLTESCALPSPEKDPALIHDLGVNDHVMAAEVLFCRQNNSIIGRVWSPVSAFDDSASWQNLIGYWVAKLNNVTMKSQSFDVSSDPETEPAPYHDFAFQAPPDGQIYELYLTGTVKQMPCNNGAAPQTFIWPYTVQRGQIIIRKTGTYIAGATFDVFVRNSDKDAWEYLDSRTIAPWDVTELNGVETGQVDLVFNLKAVAVPYPTVKVVERTDQLPWYVWPVDASGHRTDGVLYAVVDANHLVATVDYRNVTGRLYLPIIKKDIPQIPACVAVSATIGADKTVTGSGSGQHALSWRVIRQSDGHEMASGEGSVANFGFTGDYGVNYQLQFKGADGTWTTAGCVFSFTPPPPTFVCADYSAEVYIAGSKVAEYTFIENAGLSPSLNLLYYQAMRIVFQREGSDHELPNGGSQFTRVLNGTLLYNTGRGPYIKIYPSQLPLYEWSKFDAWFYDDEGTRCEVKFKVWDP